MKKPLKKISIICFGWDPWSSMWKRTQSLMFHISKKSFVERLIFINPIAYPSRILINPNSELLSIRGKTKWKWVIPRNFSEKIFIITPLFFLPFTERFNIFKKINYGIVIRLVKFFLRDKKYILVLNNISSDINNLSRFLIDDAYKIVFDWSDDFAAFGNGNEADRKKTQEICDFYIKKADIVFAVNEKLRKRGEQLNANTYLLQNATDYSNFSRAALEKTIVPVEIQKLKRPVIGYIGWIVEARMDIEIIEYIANNRPESTILFVGPINSDSLKRKLSTISNLVLIPPKDYVDLPSYMKAFDVCIIPNKINAHTDGNNPIKIYDYLATGKPVVSTRTAGVEQFKDIIAIARNKEEFLEKIDNVLMSNNADLKERRQEVALQNSWGKRADDFANIIKDCLDG